MKNKMIGLYEKEKKEKDHHYVKISYTTYKGV